MDISGCGSSEKGSTGEVTAAQWFRPEAAVLQAMIDEGVEQWKAGQLCKDRNWQSLLATFGRGEYWRKKLIEAKALKVEVLHELQGIRPDLFAGMLNDRAQENLVHFRAANWLHQQYHWSGG